MREAIKIKNTAEDAIINEIIELEWRMFDQVENQGGRAGCQDDEWTFYAMRYSLFSIWSREALNSYRQDLLTALQEGRNLLTEKYGYMMEYTDPAYFNQNLKAHFPSVSAEKRTYVEQLTKLLVACEKQFAEHYPKFSGRGRPISGIDAGNVSFEVYTLGELKTYSSRTLLLYLRDMMQLCSRKQNPSVLVHARTAQFYGYSSLEEAERRIAD